MEVSEIAIIEEEIETVILPCSQCSASIETEKTTDGHNVPDAAFVFCDENCLKAYETAHDISFD